MYSSDTERHPISFSHVIRPALSSWLFPVVFALAMLSCNGNRGDAGELPPTDSINTDTLNIDSLEQLYANNVMPLAADALFDDFFFNFAASGKLQKARICFPLKVVSNGKEDAIQPGSWTTDHFYLADGCCTGIFSSEKDTEIVNDTTILQAAVQRVNLKTKAVDNYHFVRLKGAWMLTEINHTTADKVENADFLSFYCDFASNSATQYKHLHSPVRTTVPNADSDEGMLSGTFYPEQWATFKPAMMPENVMYNVVYHSDGMLHATSEDKGNTVYFVIRGIANGMATTMMFARTGNSWQLTDIVN